jgi:hypothetical protein
MQLYYLPGRGGRLETGLGEALLTKAWLYQVVRQWVTLHA